MSVSAGAQFSSLPPHEVTTLFRGSSFATKLVYEYGMSVAGEYLRGVFAGPLGELLKTDESLRLQMNPIRVRDPADLAGNHERLVQWCTVLLDAIVESLPQVPDEFRDLFDLFYAEIAKTFGDTTAAQTTLSILFLRFFCPAIVKPAELGVPLSQPLTKDRLDDLVVCAKVLQHLANHTVFGTKEQHMIPLNEFLEAQDARVRTFFTAMIASRSSSPARAAPEKLALKVVSMRNLYSHMKKYGSISKHQAHVIIQGNIPAGFLIPPPPPETVDEYRPLIFDAIPPTEEVLHEANSLRARVAKPFARIALYMALSPRQRGRKDACKISDGELKAAELLMPNDEVADARLRVLSGSPSDDNTLEFLRLLLDTNLMVVSAIFEMIKFTEASSVCRSLNVIFSHYGLGPRVVQYAIGRELLIVYSKCQPTGSPVIRISPSPVGESDVLKSLPFEVQSGSVVKRWTTRDVRFDGHQIFIYRKGCADFQSPIAIYPLFSLVQVKMEQKRVFTLVSKCHGSFTLRTTQAVIDRWVPAIKLYINPV